MDCANTEVMKLNIRKALVLFCNLVMDIKEL